MLNHVPQREQVNGAIWNLGRQVINVVGSQATPLRSFNRACVDIGADCSHAAARCPVDEVPDATPNVEH
ncbi:unannotated protein [freshwater metagenome]|uniref:Unannotated protein n=1 Tax=freshwater metagenome TaxID=449393 RepID=A0A6J7S139_9ZZZZ